MTPSALPMYGEIIERLERIEREESVRILFACESGSRAWGFPSENSDYDVRFIYAHPRDWYLSIDLEHRRDVIERPIVDALDVSGWDLRKALQLLARSNPPLLEWLGSPIVYVDTGLLGRLRRIADGAYSATACTYHYLHMARGNVREYLKGDEVWIKKYFYVLRPLLAIRWIERHRERVPMEFGTLMDGAKIDPALRVCINDLLARKRAGSELDRGPRIPVIADFIDAEMRRLEHLTLEKSPPGAPLDTLNDLFRETVSSIPSWIPSG